MDNLPPDERARIGMLADDVINVIALRYGIKVDEVQDAMHWYREHREFVRKMKHSGFLTIVGLMISASVLAFWEGLKAYVRGKP